MFSYSCPKVQSLNISFHLHFPMQTFITLVLHSFQMVQTRSQNKTAAKQNNIHSNKKLRVFADQPPSANATFFWRVVTGTLRWLASLHYLLYFLAFDWLRPAVLFFLNWTVCLFVKESHLKLSKLILNWTVRKLHCLNFVSSPENETLGRVCLSCEASPSSVSLSMLKVPNSTWITQWRSYIAPAAPETTKWYNRSSGLGGRFNLV